ncbi:MAG: two-component system activity regulator YycH [Bacilli bacterium]
MRIKEAIQTIILIVLMCISLFLTWTIITYQERRTFNDVEELSATMNSSKSALANQLVAQYVFAQTKNEFFGTQKKEVMQKVYDAFDNATVVSQSSRSISEYFPENDKRLILKYPHLKIEDIKSLFGIEAELYDTFTFNFIMIDVISNDEDQIAVSFLDSDKKRELNVKVKDVNTIQLNKLVSAIETTAPEYFIERDFGRTPLFLRKDAAEFDHIAYLAEDMSEDQVRNIYFNSDQNISRNSVKNKTTFSDGSQVVEINEISNVVTLFKGQSSTSLSKELNTTLEGQLNFLQRYPFPFDEYLFDEMINEAQKSVYRLRINGIPVYSEGNTSQINVEWSPVAYKKITRPNFFYKGTIANETFKVNLPSGKDVLQQLQSNKDINERDIEDVYIGYAQFIYDEKLGMKVIRFDPTWIVDYNGETLRFENGMLSNTLN